MKDVRILGSGEFKILRFKDHDILGFQDLKILGYEDPGSSSYQKFALKLGFLIIQKLIHCHLDLCFGSRPKHCISFSREQSCISFSKSNPVFLSAGSNPGVTLHRLAGECKWQPVKSGLIVKMFEKHNWSTCHWPTFKFNNQNLWYTST